MSENAIVVENHSVDVAVESLPLAPEIYSFDIGSRSGDLHSLDYIAGSFELEIVAGPRPDSLSGMMVARSSHEPLPLEVTSLRDRPP
jgi:hypothetical protein